MTKLFLDIETLPAETEKYEVLRQIHQKKVEDKKKVPENFEEYLEKTNLGGAFGRIACISYAIDDGPTNTLSGDETKMLRDFWELAIKVDQFVGFNILGFDLRIIWQKSVILNVKPSKYISFARFQQVPIFDVMCEWNKWDPKNNISLHELALALGFPSSKGGEVEGKNVAQAFLDGKIDKICYYCEQDVELTRKIYKRMIFEN